MSRVVRSWIVLQERLDQQKKEAEEDPNYGKTFKGQPSKEEKKAKRKQIIATIGECKQTYLPAEGL